MRLRRLLVTVAVIGSVGTAAAVGQEGDVGLQLAARGAPSAFIEQVVQIVTQAGQVGLPTLPLESKALEGWAKRGRIPPERVVAVLQELAARLASARDATVASGLDPAPGNVVASAAEALGRGMSPQDVRDLIATAPTPEEAATGLMVASALAAQGLETAAAVRAVHDAHVKGRPPEDILEFPSAVASLLGRGVPMSDVAGMILQGGTLPLPSAAGGAASRRPQNVPPSRGRPPGRP